MSKTSNLAWFLCSLEIHRTNNSSQENEMRFQSFDCFSKTNIDVEITRPFQLIYLLINLENRSDHWLYIKPKIQISDQNWYVFVQAYIKVDYKENWISTLTTVIHTLFLLILPHEIFEILNLYLRCWVFHQYSSLKKRGWKSWQGFLWKQRFLLFLFSLEVLQITCCVLFVAVLIIWLEQHVEA